MVREVISPLPDDAQEARRAAERRPRGENEYGLAHSGTQGAGKRRSVPLLVVFAYGVCTDLRAIVGGFRFTFPSVFGFQSSGCRYCLDRSLLGHESEGRIAPTPALYSTLS